MIRAIVCGYKCEEYLGKCLASIHMQSYRNFHITARITGEPHREYLVENTVKAIAECGAEREDIIALIDADDYLCDEDAFQIVVDAYAENKALLLTYGSYVNLSTNERGKFGGAYQPGENVRTSSWRCSHLKTFKKKLWDELMLDVSVFRGESGEYFKCCADRAMMIPMMEMAGHDRMAHIETILYCYNDINPASVWKTMRDESKRTREYISGLQPRRRASFE